MGPSLTCGARAWISVSGVIADVVVLACAKRTVQYATRSEEHTSELQSQSNLVCRLLLEKKKTHTCLTTYPSSRVTRRLQMPHTPRPTRESQRARHGHGANLSRRCAMLR